MRLLRSSDFFNTIGRKQPFVNVRKRPDVFDPEPPTKDNPMFRLDNVVVTPHIGGGSSGTQERIISFCWQNIGDALEGREPRNVVSP